MYVFFLWRVSRHDYLSGAQRNCVLVQSYWNYLLRTGLLFGKKTVIQVYYVDALISSGDEQGFERTGG